MYVLGGKNMNSGNQIKAVQSLSAQSPEEDFQRHAHPLYLGRNN